MRAVIFDLWDTIVDFPVAASQALEREWAALLGRDPGEFAQAWRAGRLERDTGVAVADSLRALGVDDHLVEELARMRRDFVREALVPRPGAVETLRELRRRSYGVGLITVCTEDVPVLWDGTAFAGLFDSTVFSATCRLRKPDPAIYRIALDELRVEAGDALFVGDGANDELAGAERVGMRAALIHRPGQEPLWPEAREWAGARITSVPGVLDLLAR